MRLLQVEALGALEYPLGTLEYPVPLGCPRVPLGTLEYPLARGTLEYPEAGNVATCVHAFVRCVRVCARLARVAVGGSVTRRVCPCVRAQPRWRPDARAAAVGGAALRRATTVASRHYSCCNARIIAVARPSSATGCSTVIHCSRCIHCIHCNHCLWQPMHLSHSLYLLRSL